MPRDKEPIVDHGVSIMGRVFVCSVEREKRGWREESGRLNQTAEKEKEKGGKTNEVHF